MKRILLAVVAGVALFAAAPSVQACPLCKDAIPEGAEGQSDYDPERQSRGYNESIYMMLSVPAALMSVLGVVIYRQCRRVNDTQV